MTRNRAWNRAWFGVALAFVACGTPDNGGVDISFGPVSVSSTSPIGTIGDGESSSEGGESSSTTDEPEDPSMDPPPPDPTDWQETTESSTGIDESSSDGGDPAAVDCVGLDEATCGLTPGCGWPIGNELFGMPSGPCAWDPLACTAFDQLTCTASPACTLAVNELNQQICTGISCQGLDELTCPTILGCLWIEQFGGGGCLG